MTLMPALRPQSLSIAPALLFLVMIGLAGCGRQPMPPSAGTEIDAPQRFTVEQLHADFDALYAGLRAAHVDLFERRSEAEFEALHAQMRAELDSPLTEAEARQRFQRFVAFGRVAHARIDLDDAGWARFREQGGRAFPLSLRVQGETVRVLDNFSGDPRLAAGTRVLAVDSEPALEWLDRHGVLVSADTPYLLHAQMEHQLPKLVWLQQGEVAVFELQIESALGEPLSLDVSARSRAEFIAALEGEAGRFELDFNERSARIFEHGVAYLRPGPFYDNREDAPSPWDTTAFKAFVDASFRDFRAAAARQLLIDLRDNPGGDNSFSDHLLAYIADRRFSFTESFVIRASAQTRASIAARVAADPDPNSTSARMLRLLEGAADGDHVRFEIEETSPRAEGRFEGQVFVLINRHSYSNAVMVAAIVQDFGFGRVIGEETSDLASTLGAMEHFELPLTGIRVGYPKARMLRPSGDPTPRGVVPDWPIETPLEVGNEDLVLQQALSRIVSSAEADSP